jgi:hypothetical protein
MLIEEFLEPTVTVYEPDDKDVLYCKKHKLDK